MNFMKKIKQLVFEGLRMLLLCAAALAQGGWPTPTKSDVGGVWSGCVDQIIFARLELDTNGTGFLCLGSEPGKNLFLVEGWRVSDFTVEIWTRDTSTPIN